MPTILIDADGCPVADLTVRIGQVHGVPVKILCDTAHRIEREGAETLVFDKGADSVDFALVNRVTPGDIVITQDYGLATMCLGPYTDPHFAGASKYMLTFCQACCPRLAIEVPLDDPLSRFRLAYWLDRGFVPAALAPSGRAISLLLHGE